MEIIHIFHILRLFCFDRYMLPIQKEYLSIAKETEWLLENGMRFGGHQPISSKYRELMKKQNYTDFHGVAVGREALRHDFVKKYEGAFFVELLPYEGNFLSWLRYLQESIGFNLRLIHHILLMRFLPVQWKTFLI